MIHDSSDRDIPGFEDWSICESLGKFIIDGPRAILAPDDPEARQKWLERDLSLTQFQLRRHRYESRQLYLPSRLVEHLMPSLMLLRVATWDSFLDRRRFKEGTLESLAISVIHFLISPVAGDVLDSTRSILDAGVKGFASRCNESLLETAGTSNDETGYVAGNACAVKLSHDMDIGSLTLGWIQPNRFDKLDECWANLWELLGELTKRNVPIENWIERFELQPLGHVDWDSTSADRLNADIADFLQGE